MPSTYEPIATTTLGTNGSVTFSSIPQTYTDLILIVNGKATGGGQFSIEFNSSTSGYGTTVLTANGSTIGGTYNNSANYLQLGYYGYFDASNQAVAIAHIMNYSNTTTYKTVIATENNSATGVDSSAGCWRSTTAITSLRTFAAGQSFASGTVVSLYGIKAA